MRCGGGGDSGDREAIAHEGIEVVRVAAIQGSDDGRTAHRRRFAHDRQVAWIVLEGDRCDSAYSGCTQVPRLRLC